MALLFQEKCGNPEEPGGSGHSIEQQRANAFYLLNSGTGGGGAITPTDITGAIDQILGRANYNSAGGRINRTLPLYHPLYTALYATNISRQWGIGLQTPTNALAPVNSIGVAGTNIAQFALYQQYWFAVDFLPRDYAIVADASIFNTPFTYYDDTDTLVTGKVYFPEWYRFCDSTSKPAPSNDVNLTQFGGMFGTMKFVTQSGADPNAVPFQGAFQVLLPNQVVTVQWFNVPLRYITSKNSYIARAAWRNRVNQNPVAFTKFAADPGELLYLGFDYKAFTPPNPQFARLFNAVNAPGQLCNIQLYFLYTSRKCSDPPTTAVTNGVDTFQLVGAQSRIVNGHNLLYNFKWKNFYYAKTQGSGLPSFRSFPAEILFTDPDVEGALTL